MKKYTTVQKYTRVRVRVRTNLGPVDAEHRYDLRYVFQKILVRCRQLLKVLERKRRLALSGAVLDTREGFLWLHIEIHDHVGLPHEI